jgi:hypothetical protein
MVYICRINCLRREVKRRAPVGLLGKEVSDGKSVLLVNLVGFGRGQRHGPLAIRIGGGPIPSISGTQ